MTTIALVGDSHTQIIFPYLRKTLESLGYTIVLEESKAGWSAKKFLQNDVLSRLLNADPDIVILSLGNNNQDLSDGFSDIFQQITKGFNYYWVSPTTAIRDDVEKRHLWTHNKLKKIVPSPRYINIREVTETGHRGDNVHYTRDQYKIISDFCC